MSTVTSSDGTVIDYDSYGDGPTVIFVAGAVQHRRIDPGTSAAAARLGDNRFNAIVYDRRGRDRSGDTPPWVLQREVEDVAALIEATGRTATLYSSSSGAAVALAAAVSDVGVTGLILYEPPFFRGADKSHQIAAVEALLAEGRYEDAMRYNFTDVLGIPGDVVNGIAKAPTWPAMCEVAATLVYDFCAISEVNTDPDWESRWADVAVPVSVCSGTRSFPPLAGAADQVAEAIPGAQRRILPDQDHNPSPEAITDAVTEFQT